MWHMYTCNRMSVMPYHDRRIGIPKAESCKFRSIYLSILGCAALDVELWGGLICPRQDVLTPPIEGVIPSVKSLDMGVSPSPG